MTIGLTGGIGSGKSTVAKIFETLGAPVYYADEAARVLMNTDSNVIAAVKKNFGEESYNHGELNRPYIASIVFNDTYKLDILNSITHPATIAHAKKWIQQQNAPYTIKEAALIFEAGSSEGLDYVIGVYAPKALRLKRVINRDKTTPEEVLKRMNRQINEEMKMKLCDFVIINDEQCLLIPQVLKLHEKFLSDSDKKRI
ncbi:MAG: dephospho-CoA kinase [Bacteroidetes bacterium]|nr:dephospho-CoA kinase [Bacteroidota bacterium]